MDLLREVIAEQRALRLSFEAAKKVELELKEKKIKVLQEYNEIHKQMLERMQFAYDT